MDGVPARLGDGTLPKLAPEAPYSPSALGRGLLASFDRRDRLFVRFAVRFVGRTTASDGSGPLCPLVANAKNAANAVASQDQGGIAGTATRSSMVENASD